MAKTTVVIENRETTEFDGFLIPVSGVINSYSGNIDLSGMDVTTETDAEGNITHTFRNRTGVKGINPFDEAMSGTTSSDQTSTSITQTVVKITGFPDNTLPGDHSESSIRLYYAGSQDLSTYEATTTVVGDTREVSFSMRTGTKGDE